MLQNEQFVRPVTIPVMVSSGHSAHAVLCATPVYVPRLQNSHAVISEWVVLESVCVCVCVGEGGEEVREFLRCCCVSCYSHSHLPCRPTWHGSHTKLFEKWPGAHVAASLIETDVANDGEVFVPSLIAMGRSVPDAAHIVRVMAVNVQFVTVWKHSKEPKVIDVVCSAMFSLGRAGPKFVPKRR